MSPDTDSLSQPDRADQAKAESWLDGPTVVKAGTGQDGLRDPPQLALVAYAGSAMGRIFPLYEGEIILGRSPAVRLSLLDGEVSRQHAAIRVERTEEGGLKVWVEDLGSTNGTFVNGSPLKRPRGLKAGDRIALGGHVFKLVVMDSLEREFHQTLLDQSTRDSLTGLANRGTALTELQNRFHLALRYGRPLSVIMCDVDHFKRINDELGHASGDQVLRAVGERILQTLREVDLAGRIGGEEFLLILPETDLRGATIVAERLRQAIGREPIAVGEGLRTVMCSLGVAEIQPTDNDGGMLMARADEALYKAKAGGRNRVEGGA